MRMGFIDDAALTGGLFMITAGMARPRTGHAQTETAFDSILLAGGTIAAAGALSVKIGNAAGAKSK